MKRDINQSLVALAVEETAMLLVTRRGKNFPAIQKRERALGVSHGESIIHELGTRSWQQWGRVAQEYHDGLQWPVLPLLDRGALVVSRLGSNAQRPAEECWTAVKIWGISVNAPCLQSWVGETRGYKGGILWFKVHFSEHGHKHMYLGLACLWTYQKVQFHNKDLPNARVKRPEF